MIIQPETLNDWKEKALIYKEILLYPFWPLEVRPRFSDLYKRRHWMTEKNGWSWGFNTYFFVWAVLEKKKVHERRAVSDTIILVSDLFQRRKRLRPLFGVSSVGIFMELHKLTGHNYSIWQHKISTVFWNPVMLLQLLQFCSGLPIFKLSAHFP